MPVAQAESLTITNPLGLDWPWELVHFDLKDKVSGDVSVKIGDETRPAQIAVGPDGKSQQLWFLATVKKPEKGDTNPTGGKTEVTIVPTKSPSPLAITKFGANWVVSNGEFEFQIPNFEKFSGVKPLKDLPAILGGVRRAGDPQFFGKSSWTGDALVKNARTEVLASGPVFIDLKVTIELETAGFGDGAAQAVPNFDNAKSADLKDVPKGIYEAILRFVAGDPWADVTERYNLAAPVSYKLEFKDDLKADTVMFIPWFGYEAFGGNSDMRFTKLEPRPKQTGPFVALRPRWSQMPGGGMDFFLTRGGATATDKAPNPSCDANAPAFGIIATNPIKWFNPYAQTINVTCENGDTATLKFPVGSGARSYAVVTGPREKFDNTGKLNFLVRRHTDWTLDDQINKYVLEWPRNPDLAGPHILITREELQRLQKDYKSGAATPEMEILKEFVAKKNELKGNDRDLLDLITRDAPPKAPKVPGADAWLGQRFQSDGLNPTSPANRRMGDNLEAADLASNGQPIGGPSLAAIGYIYTNLNNWPGYQNGWGPGNPNFHTDKYLAAIYVAATIPDHPDAKSWLEFGKKNFLEDTKKVFLPPDGVGYECPGYSGYSLRLQTEIANVLRNTGYSNPIAENPLFAKSLVWHRHMLTPPDQRIGLRHEAPIGDTHRWTAGAGEAYGTVAKAIKKENPALASEFMGVWKLLRSQGMRGSLVTDLIDLDQTIPATPVEKMDWGSHAFFGFGSVMRSRFGTPRETFVTLKAGPSRGHYHNDELSYHFYGEGTPLSLDYNCSYHPRGDHAALHNSMTFGVSRPFTHAGDEKPVEAMEQLPGRAKVGAFASTPAADVVVAEMTSDNLTLSPIYPDDAKFQYGYPTRKTAAPITHRRFLGLVKHPENSKLADYLIVRDETNSKEPQQLNIHLLAREVKRDGQLIRATGQYDTDAVVFLANPTAEKFDIGRWYYFDESMMGPGKWPRKDGKIIKPEDALEQEAWKKKIHETDGVALIPPSGWKDKWQVGEYQKWLKIATAPGTPMLWVLYPQKAGSREPEFESLADGGGVRVSLGGDIDEVYLATTPPAGIPGQAVVKQNGKETVVLKSDAVPPLGEIQEPASTELAGRVIDDSAPR